MDAEPLARLMIKLNEPRIKVSITVITRTDLTRFQYSDVLSRS